MDEGKIAEVWRDRGPFPGLGSMLSAVGFRCGEIMAKELKKHIQDPAQYETVLNAALAAPKDYFTPVVLRSLGRTELETYKAHAKRTLYSLWLMARMSLNQEQAYNIFNTEERANWASAVRMQRLSKIRTSYMSNPQMHG
jgi:hypothetical protein